jgi:hypothetical protein
MADHMTAEQLHFMLAEMERYANSRRGGSVESMDAALAGVAETAKQLAARLSGMAAVPAELLQIGELLRTQDNRITDQPLFLVQQKQTYVTEDGYNESRMVWVNEDGREAGEETARRFDSKYSGTGRRPKGWRHLAVFDVWEFVTGCFTEQGCMEYIARNGHNLKEPRIYAEGSFRNLEYQIVRNWLKALPAHAAPEPPHV